MGCRVGDNPFYRAERILMQNGQTEPVGACPEVVHGYDER